MYVFIFKPMKFKHWGSSQWWTSTSPFSGLQPLKPVPCPYRVVAGRFPCCHSNQCLQGGCRGAWYNKLFCCTIVGFPLVPSELIRSYPLNSYFECDYSLYLECSSKLYVLRLYSDSHFKLYFGFLKSCFFLFQVDASVRSCTKFKSYLYK